MVSKRANRAPRGRRRKYADELSDLRNVTTKPTKAWLDQQEQAREANNSLIKRKAASAKAEALESGDIPEFVSKMISDIAATGVVDAISEGDTSETRVLRSNGLCFIGRPEIVIEYPVEFAQQASGIYFDLKRGILSDDPDQIAKVSPGRKVIAASYACTYETVQAGGSPSWDSFERLASVNKVDGIEVVITGVFAPAPTCENCGSILGDEVLKTGHASFCSRACMQLSMPRSLVLG